MRRGPPKRSTPKRRFRFRLNLKDCTNMERELLTHRLNLGDDAEQQRIADHLSADPDAQRRLAMLRKALEPLESDRDAPEPPPNLVVRTIGRVAQHICERGDGVPADDGDRPI